MTWPETDGGDRTRASGGRPWRWKGGAGARVVLGANYGEHELEGEEWVLPECSEGAEVNGVELPAVGGGAEGAVFVEKTPRMTRELGEECVSVASPPRIRNRG